MAFVNEHISQVDWEKYNLEEMYMKHHYIGYGGTNARDWTIDKERNIYLRNVSITRPDKDFEGWHFCYDNEIVYIETINVSNGKDPRDKDFIAKRKIRMLKIPDSIIPEKPTIEDLIKEAFYSRGASGIFTEPVDEKCFDRYIQF